MTDHVAIDVVKEPTLDQEVQTDVDYPVEIVREVHIREDADKINDTDIDVDEQGHYKIFDTLANPDEPESIDQLSVQFTQRSKVSQVSILLAELKKHLNTKEEAFIKIEYVKKLYAEQLKKLVAAQRQLKDKDVQIEIKETEIAIRDE